MAGLRLEHIYKRFGDSIAVNDVNFDIENGDWRMLNLQTQPFVLPDPIVLINEQCEEVDGAYKDKSLGLWGLQQLKDLKFLTDQMVTNKGHE